MVAKLSIYFSSMIDISDKVEMYVRGNEQIVPIGFLGQCCIHRKDY